MPIQEYTFISRLIAAASRSSAAVARPFTLAIAMSMAATSLSPAQFRPFPGGPPEVSAIFGLGLRWQLANPYGIVKNEEQTQWNAGRIHDLAFSAGGGVLSASNTGGVWLTFPDGNSISLSRDWDNPDIISLTSDPTRRDHFYAACGADDVPTSIGALYETDTRAAIPLIAPWRKVNLPPGSATVYRVLVEPTRRRLIIACEGGVWWANIPFPGFSYAWKEASGDYIPGRYASIGMSSAGILTARSVNGRGGAAIFTGLFTGAGAGTNLTLTKAKIPSVVADTAVMRRITVAACESQPQFAYASVVDSNGAIYRILASTNGGKVWTGRGGEPPPIPGDRGSGGPLHQISVAPGNPNWVGFGLLFPTWSKNGGSTWDTLGVFGGKFLSYLHSDIHEIYFDRDDPDRIWIASDGGIASSPDFGATFETFYNEKIANLGFLSTFGLREWYGTFSKSPAASGVVGGGLQDNGNVYSILDGYTPWRLQENCDGGLMQFMPNGSALFFNNGNGNDPVHQSDWDPATSRLKDIADLPLTTTKKGIRIGVDRVRTPTWRNKAGQLMFATGGDNAYIYGLFANDDGSDAQWHPVVSWVNTFGQGVCATASATGDPIFVSSCGPEGEKIFIATPSPEDVGPVLGGGPTGEITELPRPGDANPNAALTRLVDLDGKLLYGMVDVWNTIDGAHPKGLGWLIRSRDGGNRWDTLPLPREYYYGMDVDANALPARVFAASDENVYASEDGGTNFYAADYGLPRVPHGADLRFASDMDGDNLYLSTYGWSVWRARVPARRLPIVFRIPDRFPRYPFAPKPSLANFPSIATPSQASLVPFLDSTPSQVSPNDPGNPMPDLPPSNNPPSNNPPTNPPPGNIPPSAN